VRFKLLIPADHLVDKGLVNNYTYKVDKNTLILIKRDLRAEFSKDLEIHKHIDIKSI
tara:strand:- start:956 stop:1126 length:171 start_codon:yes stop_codon:yes gene_type:complete